MDTSNYVKELCSTKEFARLLELKEIIAKKYDSLIVSMKNKEAIYLEAKEHEAYYSNFKEIKNAFILAKKELYTKPEVMEYFKLEKQVQAMIDSDINELKASISNKFVLKKNIF